MELWIRSQDKMKMLSNPKLAIIPIGDVLNGYSYEIYDTTSYNQNTNLRYEWLGIYKTEERALEVLDEIQNKINLINLGYDFGSPMVDLKNPTYIYQMPKK